MPTGKVGHLRACLCLPQQTDICSSVNRDHFIVRPSHKGQTLIINGGDLWGYFIHTLELTKEMSIRVPYQNLIFIQR
jgi:hypothetical protein